MKSFFLACLLVSFAGIALCQQPIPERPLGKEKC